MIFAYKQRNKANYSIIPHLYVRVFEVQRWTLLSLNGSPTSIISLLLTAVSRPCKFPLLCLFSTKISVYNTTCIDFLDWLQ